MVFTIICALKCGILFHRTFILDVRQTTAVHAFWIYVAMISSMAICLAMPALGYVLTTMSPVMLPLYSYMKQKLYFFETFQIIDVTSIEVNQIKLLS